MKIKINGKTETVGETVLTIAGLLKIAKVENPEMVSVQRNGEFVAKENFDDTCLKDGDEVDFLYFMGGGARGGAAPEGENS